MAVLGGHTEAAQASRRRHKVARRVFGVDSGLDGVAAVGERILPGGQRLPGGHPKLPLDKIVAGDHLGHRVLDLKSGVHLHEVIGAGAGIDDELDRTGTDIADGAGRRNRGLAERGAQSPAEAWGRRFLDHFLMAPLDRAFAFEKVDDRTQGIGENLDLDMPRAFDPLLDQHPRIAERALGLAARGLQRLV